MLRITNIPLVLNRLVCHSCHPANSIRALKGTESTDPHQGMINGLKLVCLRFAQELAKSRQDVVGVNSDEVKQVWRKLMLLKEKSISDDDTLCVKRVAC